MSNYNTKEILETSLENVLTLKSQLQKIDKMRDDIAEVLESGIAIQQNFSSLGADVVTKSSSFLEANSKLLKDEILLFESKLNNLDKKIAKLENLNLKSVFEDANVSFADSLNTLFDSRFKDLKDLYANFGVKINGLDAKIQKLDNLDLKSAFKDANDSFSDSLNKLFDLKFKDLRILYSDFEKLQQNLKDEIQNLKAIDLEEHFFKHDKKLSDIFSSINNISGTLLSINEHLIKTQGGISNLEKVFIEEISTFEKQINVKFEATTKRLENKLDSLNGRINTLLILLIVSLLFGFIGLFTSMKSLF